MIKHYLRRFCFKVGKGNTRLIGREFDFWRRFNLLDYRLALRGEEIDHATGENRRAD
jgi:hypothetical protein